MRNREIMRHVESVLKQTTCYKENSENNAVCNYQLDYVLVKGGDKAIPDDMIAFASCGEYMIKFNPLKGADDVCNVFDWSFSFDSDLFMYLENGFELAGMSLNGHCCVWSFVELTSNEYTDYLDGKEAYFRYCDRNGVTEELLSSLFIDDGFANCSEDTATAIVELESSLQRESKIQETMAQVNAYYHRHRTLDGCPYLNVEETAKIKADMEGAWHWEDAPYTSFQVERVNDRVRQLQDTIKTFKRRLSEIEQYSGCGMEENGQLPF